MATKVHPGGSEALGFLAFIDACAEGGIDAVKRHTSKPMQDFLAKSNQAEGFYALYATQAGVLAGNLDRATARVLPYDAAIMPGKPAWCKRYIVDAVCGGMKGTVCFMGQLQGDVLWGAFYPGLAYEAGSLVTIEGFECQQPRLIYQPHSWVTIRSPLKWSTGDAEAAAAVAAAAVAGFLSFIDACAEGGVDGVKAHTSKGMQDYLDNCHQADKFYKQYASQAATLAGNLERATAKVQPYDAATMPPGYPTWCKKYTVDAVCGGVKGTVCFMGCLTGDLLTSGYLSGLAFTPEASSSTKVNEEAAAAAAPNAAGAEAKISHYLVIVPLLRSMERDGVPRYALHEAVIECEDKLDVPGLEHFVAALVPASKLSNTVVIHKFVRLSTQLISSEDSVPPGWSPTPLVHKGGKWGVAPGSSGLDTLRPGRYGTGTDEKRFEGIAKIAAEHGFQLRGKDEKDWHYARRAQQFLNCRVKYDAHTAGSSNDGKPPAQCLSTRVAHCGHFSEGYRELLAMGGVLCRSAIGEWIAARGKCHCVNDVFLEGCGWVPVEPGKDPTVVYDAKVDQWGPPNFAGHPTFGYCDDMLITDHFVDYNEHANDVRILFGSGDGDGKSINDNAKLEELVESLFKQFDTNGNGTLEMGEARNMVATLLNVNEHWMGADTALNEAAHALDLHRDGVISKQELLDAIKNDQRGVGHLLLSAAKQVKMGQNIAQVRPVVDGNIVDGVVTGKVGNPITSLGHALLAQQTACNYTNGIKRAQWALSVEHVVFHDDDCQGNSCPSRQSISKDEAVDLFAKIEARCQAAFEASHSGDHN